MFLPALCRSRPVRFVMFPYWSQVTDPENAGATALNTLPKHVVTSRPDPLTWHNARPRHR
jgi:hypothetical protein